MDSDTSNLSALIGTTEAALLLGVSDETIRRLCSQGKLPFVRISTRGARAIPRDAVIQLKALRQAERQAAAI